MKFPFSGGDRLGYPILVNTSDRTMTPRPPAELADEADCVVCMRDADQAAGPGARVHEPCTVCGAMCHHAASVPKRKPILCLHCALPLMARDFTDGGTAAQ